MVARKPLAVGPGGGGERMERRASIRRPVLAEALVEAKRATPQERENAQVEDRSPGGMCIRSAMPVKNGDTLILYVGEESNPLRAKVMWARRDGVLVSRRTGKPCQALLAGCRVVPMEAKPKKEKQETYHLWAHLASSLVRYSIVLGGLGLLGVLIYWLVGLFFIFVK